MLPVIHNLQKSNYKCKQVHCKHFLICVFLEKNQPKLVPKFQNFIYIFPKDITERTARCRFSSVGLWRDILPKGIMKTNPPKDVIVRKQRRLCHQTTEDVVIIATMQILIYSILEPLICGVQVQVHLRDSMSLSFPSSYSVLYKKCGIQPPNL